MCINMLTNRRQTAPSWKKYLIAGWAFVECLFFSGILYGWSSLVFVLKEEGIYADLCNNGDKSEPQFDSGFTVNTPLDSSDITTSIPLTNDNSTNSTAVDSRIQLLCKQQDSMLSLCFTIGSSVFCASCVVMGHVNYKLGTRITRLIAFTFFTVGSICLAMVSKGNPWLVFPGLSCIGIGGLPLLVTNIQLAHQNGIARRYQYFILTGMHAMTLVSTFLFLPRGFITITETKLDPEFEMSEAKHLSTDLLKSDRQKARRLSIADRQPLSGYIKHPMFISHTFWLCLLQLRFYYFIGNLNTYLNRLLDGDNNLVSHFTNVCFYSMMCGLVASFLAGVVYDKQKGLFVNGRTKIYRALMPAILPLMLASILAVLMSVLVPIPNKELLYPIFIIVTLFRSFLDALNNAFISAVFPTEYFSMLYGIIIISAGIFSCLQYAFFHWAESYKEAPFQADVCLLCVSIASLIHPTYIWIACLLEEKSEG